MMRNIISLFFFLSIACRTEGAKTEEEPSEGTEAGESGSTDTDTDIEEEQEEEGDGVSPVITSAESEYTFVTGYGDLIELVVEFTDPQNDVDGGMIFISSSEGNFLEDIDSSNMNPTVYYEEGQVTVLLEATDTSVAYTFTVQIQDSQGNQSDEVETTCTPE